MQQLTSAPKPIKCKAAVCRASGEPLQIEEVTVAPPQAHEVRVKIICSALCHSDTIFWKLKEPLAVFPRIFGHESIGVVESVGEFVEEVAAGDTVLPVFLPLCGDCPDCRSSESNMCSRLRFDPASPVLPRNRSTRFTDSAGAPIHHFLNVSSFSEYTVLDVANLVRVDAPIPPEKACLLSCGIATGVGAAWKLAAVKPGSTVAIFGLGAIGLAVSEGARLRGAGRIIGVDTNPDKFEIGKKFGVTDFVNPKNTGERHISEVIKEMTGGGADYCFESVGSASVMADAFKSARGGWGKTVVLGVDLRGNTVNVSPMELLDGKSILGSTYGSIKSKTDVPILIDKYLNKELHLDEFVTHQMGLEDVNVAYELLLAGKSLRCVVWMDKK